MKVLCFFLLMEGFVVCEGQVVDGRRGFVGLGPVVVGGVQSIGFDSVRVRRQ